MTTTPDRSGKLLTTVSFTISFTPDLLNHEWFVVREVLGHSSRWGKLRVILNIFLVVNFPLLWLPVLPIP